VGWAYGVRLGVPSYIFKKKVGECYPPFYGLGDSIHCLNNGYEAQCWPRSSETHFKALAKALQSMSSESCRTRSRAVGFDHDRQDDPYYWDLITPVVWRCS